MKYLVSVLGVTASGKTTFIDFAKKQCPDLVRSVNIGQILRAKYPPSYFEGKDSMPKTEQEVQEILEDYVREFNSSESEVLLIDGQPRTIHQIDFLEHLIDKYKLDGIQYVWVDCLDAEREKRGTKRSKTEDELELFNARKVGDKISVFEVLFSLLDRMDTVVTCDTSSYDVSAEFLWTLRYVMGKWGYKV